MLCASDPKNELLFGITPNTQLLSSLFAQHLLSIVYTSHIVLIVSINLAIDSYLCKKGPCYVKAWASLELYPVPAGVADL